MKKTFISISIISITLCGCTASTTEIVTNPDVWDELRCAEEGGLIIEGDPLKCRISKEENGEIFVSEMLLGEQTLNESEDSKQKLSEIIERLDISFENSWTIENPVIGNEGAVILMNDEYVQLYLFNSEEEARETYVALENKTQLPRDVKIDWGEDATFFMLNEVIAVYQGGNSELFIKDE